jgi:hypothetical protein
VIKEYFENPTTLSLSERNSKKQFNNNHSSSSSSSSSSLIQYSPLSSLNTIISIQSYIDILMNEREKKGF